MFDIIYILHYHSLVNFLNSPIATAIEIILKTITYFCGKPRYKGKQNKIKKGKTNAAINRKVHFPKFCFFSYLFLLAIAL